MQRQIDVIELMGIGHIQDVIIGDTRRKGISGGERKRVCVAIELLTAPKLLFLVSERRRTCSHTGSNRPHTDHSAVLPTPTTIRPPRTSPPRASTPPPRSPCARR